MSVMRNRKAASARLGIELDKRLGELRDARGEDEINTAAIILGGVFNDNIEYIIFVLKKFGGIDVQPPAAPKRPKHDPTPTMPTLPVLNLPDVANDESDGGAAFLETLPCTCPPLEHGIIGRDKHMNSCPKFRF